MLLIDPLALYHVALSTQRLFINPDKTSPTLMIFPLPLSLSSNPSQAGGNAQQPRCRKNLLVTSCRIQVVHNHLGLLLFRKHRLPVTISSVVAFILFWCHWSIFYLNPECLWRTLLETLWKLPRSLALKFVTPVLRGAMDDGCFYTHEAPTILYVLYLITESAQ